jgi:hypothetical protein
LTCGAPPRRTGSAIVGGTLDAGNQTGIGGVFVANGAYLTMIGTRIINTEIAVENEGTVRLKDVRLE